MSDQQMTFTYDLNLLEPSRRAWQSKPGLRRVYQEFYTEMLASRLKGRSLELGSGIGVVKEVDPSVVTSDIVKTPYVDRVASAYDIPLDDGKPWANILALDVLHHLRTPFKMLESAGQALAPGGQLILMEPASTPWGRGFYSMFHSEPTKPERIRPPYEFEPDDAEGNFANMAMAVELFQNQLESTQEKLENYGLVLRQCTYRDFLAYPLTGGYSGRQLVPTSILGGILRLEAFLPQCLLRCFGLRLLVVLEKVNEIE